MPKEISDAPPMTTQAGRCRDGLAVAAAVPAVYLQRNGSLAPFERKPLLAWRRMIATAGPGLLIAVGYVDPGNWATDLGGGARYGYTLLSIVLLASVIAMMAQALCVRVAIATGKGLAELCREVFPAPVVVSLWLLAEVAMVATDIAELIGGAVALKLLFGIGLLPGMLAVSACTFVILWLGGDDWRLRSLVCILMVVIAASFVVLLILAQPEWRVVATSLLPPPALLGDPTMLLIAVGIIGATVMPHNLYLHSGLLAPAGRALDRAALRGAIGANLRDSNLALAAAFFINASILVAAGAVFHTHGITEIPDLGAAHDLLNPVLGSSVAAAIFALALLAAGQTSTITGTLAGQLVMEGFIRIRLSPLVRRLITRVAALGPALLYFAWEGTDDSSHLLILSQVVLSLQLPFAIIPLAHFAGSRRLMGDLVLSRTAKACSWAMVLAVIAFNAILIGQLVI
jgi:manganese transport protein